MSQRFSRPVEMRVFQTSVGGDDRLHELVDVGAGQARNGNHARSAQLRQETVGLGAQFARLVAFVGDQVPLVEPDDQRPALLLDQIGERQVLLFERDSGVEHEHDHFRETHRPQRVGDGELLDLAHDARPSAQASGVEDLELPPAPFGVKPDTVARDAGLGAGQQAVLPEDAVDKRRLAGVGPPEHGDAQRLGDVEFAAVLLLAEKKRLGFLLLRDEARGRAEGLRASAS